MSTVNGIGSVAADLYSAYPAGRAPEVKKDSKEVTQEAAAVYEKGSSDKTIGSPKKNYVQNTDLVAKLKADAENRVAQMRSLVEKTISNQGKAGALGTGDDSIWKFFAEGDFSNVDEAAKAQAAKDIAEGGYWSVGETSKRILDFAKALTGGDPDKIDSMMDAFKKGFDEATKAWGKELPDISSKTYDAVMKGFDDWKNEAAVQ